MQHQTRLRIAPQGLTALFLATLLQGCGDSGSSGGFQAPRETTNRPPAPAANPGALPAGGAEGVLLEWDLPAGWSELPTSSFRQANFRLPGTEKAECYLSLLGGEAGGLESNITRWRSQISLPPLTAAEAAALPHVQLLGRDGVVVDFAGTWKGMSGTENEPGSRLVGILQVDASGSAFFKMYGPDARIAAEKEHFLALAHSLRPSHAGMTAKTPAAAPGGAPPPMSATDPAVASMAGDQQGLAWMAPGTWTKGAENKMRTVTYATASGAECYVTRISGDAGGLGANINRWRTQLGCPALSADEIEKLEHLNMLGVDGRMVLIEGAGDSAGKAMLGAMAVVGGRATFVKLTGPKDAVQKELENFKAFAQTLKETQ
jgi:hypothetical protein